MIEYTYPLLSPRWNLWIVSMKLEKAGLKPDYLKANQETIFLYYPRELTSEDKSTLDKLMSKKEIGLYPESSEGYTVITIQDLYDSWKQLEQKSGTEIEFIFANIPRHDQIELWIKGELTNKEIRKLKDAYIELFKG